MIDFWHKMIEKYELSNMHSLLHSRFQALQPILCATARLVFLKYLVNVLTSTFQNLQEFLFTNNSLPSFHNNLLPSSSTFLKANHATIPQICQPIESISSFTYSLPSMPSHFWPNLSYSSRSTWASSPPRSFPDYSQPSGPPFWEFHGNTTSLTLLSYVLILFSQLNYKLFEGKDFFFQTSLSRKAIIPGFST